jgi:hypothetical protein
MLDRDHASLVESAVTLLSADGWIPVPEVTFQVYGERGSIDILAWHPIARILLVIEVKSVVPDVQATLAASTARRDSGRSSPAIVAGTWRRPRASSCSRTIAPRDAGLSSSGRPSTMPSPLAHVRSGDGCEDLSGHLPGRCSCQICPGGKLVSACGRRLRGSRTAASQVPDRFAWSVRFGSGQLTCLPARQIWQEPGATQGVGVTRRVGGRQRVLDFRAGGIGMGGPFGPPIRGSLGMPVLRPL